MRNVFVLNGEDDKTPVTATKTDTNQHYMIKNEKKTANGDANTI